MFCAEWLGKNLQIIRDEHLAIVTHIPEIKIGIDQLMGSACTDLL